MLAAAKAAFLPEFLNRIDEIVTFRRSRRSRSSRSRALVRRRVADRLRDERGIELEVDAGAGRPARARGLRRGVRRPSAAAPRAPHAGEGADPGDPRRPAGRRRDVRATTGDDGEIALQLPEPVRHLERDRPPLGLGHARRAGPSDRPRAERAGGDRVAGAAAPRSSASVAVGQRPPADPAGRFHRPRPPARPARDVRLAGRGDRARRDRDERVGAAVSRSGRGREGGGHGGLAVRRPRDPRGSAPAGCARSSRRSASRTPSAGRGPTRRCARSGRCARSRAACAPGRPPPPAARSRCSSAATARRRSAAPPSWVTAGSR